ncbi:MAG: hypothetical protein C5B50_09230 [Verrucomicrobia bacterium]|nr:MAG: hypothetical protein C5B50_09230 [Verrucomicrobiota bacterium]
MSEAGKKSVPLIFKDALERPLGAERDRFLDEACGNDSVLRQRIEKLLRAHDEAGGFLGGDPEKPQQALSAPDKAASAPTEKAGDRIGRYKLLQQIGEGGCGVVYMAEQEEPVRRKVALKVIKLGMDTRQVVARFEAERQALAMMDHPNIARVLEAGATDSGRPYFIMELVRGKRITEFCDEQELSPRERLELFAQVCSAVQHAHQKGIIHRDLKPSNILVTTVDGRHVPKVIDFGIAKATGGQRLTNKTVFTAFEQFIGTPAYMSPEQAQMSGVDIDTRTDIYSLGVVLYELLTGRTPFDAKRLLEAGLDEIRRVVREEEPARPSTRLQTLSQIDLKTVARARRLDAPKLIHLVKGDLDWVAMKCLEKDRDRRYQTANALAVDIQRHLENEPVVARPPGGLYRLQKLVLRNKVAFTAASVVLFVLVAGLAASTWQAIRASRAEKEQRRLRNVAEQARAQAEKEKLAARRTAYASDMRLVQNAIETRKLGSAREILNRHRPGAGEADLRGWEWRYLWSLCRSEAQNTLCQRSNSVFSILISHDGQWVAVGEQEGGIVSVMDLATSKQIALLSAGRGRTIAAFSPREPLLAFAMEGGGSDYRIGFWDGRTRQRLPDELLLAARCGALTFSRDGQTLIVLSEDPEDQIKLWRVSDRHLIASHPTPDVGGVFLPHGFAISRHSNLAAYRAKGSQLCVIDLDTGAERWRTKSPDQAVWGLAFSTDDRILASGGGLGDGAIFLWDVSSGRQVGRLQGHTAIVTSLDFLPDGKSLVSASCDETIRVWNLSDLMNTPAPRILSGHKHEVWRLAASPDGKTFVSGSKDGEVLVWDTRRQLAQQNRVTLPDLVAAWRFTADNKSVVCADRAGHLAQWDGPDFRQKTDLRGKTAAELGLGEPPRSKPGWLVSGLPRLPPQFRTDPPGGLLEALSPDGRFFAQAPTTGRFTAQIASGGGIWMWDRQDFNDGSAQIQPRVFRSLTAFSLAFSPDSTRLAVGNGTKEAIKIWDVETRRELLALPGNGGLFHNTAFASDESLLGSINEAGQLHLWRAPSWAEIELEEARVAR